MKRQVTSPRLAAPSGASAQAAVVEVQGKLVFVSGVTAERADGTLVGAGNPEAQLRQVYVNLGAALEASGGVLDDVVRLDIWLRNIEHAGISNRVGQEHFRAPFPASSTVEVAKFAAPQCLVEVSAIAVLGGR